MSSIDSLDVQTVEVTSFDAEHNQMEMIAKMAAQVLSKHYPNHWWMIGWAPGAVLVIKLGGADAQYGYTVDAAKAASISELEHAIMYGGGELLERLNLPRGAWNGEEFKADYQGTLQ